MGNSYHQRAHNFKNAENNRDKTPAKTYSCLTEEEFEKAKDYLTEEEKRVISELHN